MSATNGQWPTNRILYVSHIYKQVKIICISHIAKPALERSRPAPELPGPGPQILYI